MKVEDNALVRFARGMFGGQLVFRKTKHGTIAQKPPGKRKKKTTKRQHKNESRFTKASAWAVKVLLDPAIKAEYTERIDENKHTAYLVAISDYLKGPKVNEIDTTDYQGLIGDEITIDAHDNFKILSVRVALLKDNVLLEEGDAAYGEGDWIYECTTENKDKAGTIIMVKAYDRPGNVGEKIVEVE